mgnify:CR=1 FL=1
MISLLRPHHWIKNLLIIAPLFFAKDLFSVSLLLNTIYAFIAFSLAASIVYILNDIADRESDMQHPEKKERAIASGRVSISQAFALLAVLTIGNAIFIALFISHIWLLIAGYVVLNILYSFSLKNISLVGIMMVASFYVLRIWTGGMAAAVPISEWIILCTFFASLLVLTAKRLASQKKTQYSIYTASFLQTLLLFTAGLTVMSYSLYSILAIHSSLGVYSILFVIIGVLRYLQLTEQSLLVEYPEKILLTDPLLISSIIGWSIYMFFIFYIL